jgi:hypothetical protein
VSALRRTADAQASLQEQFDRHECVPLDSSRPTDLLLRQEPEEDDEEEEDDRKKEKKDDEDDDETDDGYSE